MPFVPATLQLGAGSKIMIGDSQLGVTPIASGNELVLGETRLVDNASEKRFEIHRSNELLLSIGEPQEAGDSSPGDSSPASY